MASLHRMRRSKYWYGAFTMPDGTRTLRSTGATQKTKAAKILAEWVKATEAAKTGRLTELRTRDVMLDIFRIANDEELPSTTLRDFGLQWLARKKPEIAEASYTAYAQGVKLLVAGLEDKADKPMDAVNRRDAVKWRDTLLERLASGSVAKYLKIARMVWGDAVTEHTCRENVFQKVSIKDAKGNTRRAFTVDEIKRILAQCDNEWRGIVLTGLYTGQRLGDIASLTWRQVDIAEREIHFVTRKTDKPLHIPIHDALLTYLMKAPSADDPDAPIWPSVYGKTTNTLSRQFNEILQDAGLAVRKTHEGQGKGRDSKRNVAGLSYHCLRHTATSMLKNAGVSGVIAQAIIGHDSEAVSRAYTHIETKTLRTAVDLLPVIN